MWIKCGPYVSETDSGFTLDQLWPNPYPNLIQSHFRYDKIILYDTNRQIDGYVMNKGALTFLGVVKENVTPWDIIQCALRIFVFHVQYKVILLNAHGQRLETSPGNKYGKKTRSLTTHTNLYPTCAYTRMTNSHLRNLHNKILMQHMWLCQMWTDAIS